MTRLAFAVAATLAAALCLLIGWRIGRLSTEPYPDTYPPEGDDGIDPMDPRTGWAMLREHGERAFPGLPPDLAGRL